MHLTPSHLSRIQFVKPGIVLPCIVHRVKIARTRTGTAATHVHLIQATGLEPIKVTLSQPFENTTRKPRSYILIRPWHSDLLDESVMYDDTSARPTTSNGALEGKVTTLAHARPTMYVMHTAPGGP